MTYQDARSIYDTGFVRASRWPARSGSARKVVPILLSVVPARSVIDIGCGVGTCADRVPRCTALERILGVDGDYVDRAMLADARRTAFVAAEPAPAASRPDASTSRFPSSVAEHIDEAHADDLRPQPAPPPRTWWPSPPGSPTRAAPTTSTSNGRATGRRNSRPTATARSTASADADLERPGDRLLVPPEPSLVREHRRRRRATSGTAATRACSSLVPSRVLGRRQRTAAPGPAQARPRPARASARASEPSAPG